MENNTMMAIEPDVFILNKKDIPALVQRFKLEVVTDSPLQPYIQPSAETREAEPPDDAAFGPALQTLARPLRMIRVYAGGGMQARGDLMMAYQPGSTLAPLVALTPSLDDSWILLAFPDTEQGITWLLDTMACNIDQAPASPFPETISPEFLLYLFGTIDQYRRSSYEQQLRYATGELPAFTMESFSDNIRQALQAKDLRWTLPALMMLMPGMNEVSLREDSAIFQQLVDAEVLLPVKQDNGEIRFTLGQVGKDLGIEFFRSWVQSAGMEISSFTNGTKIPEHRVFLAGTALANHLFELTETSDKTARIRYAPCSRNELGLKLEGWLGYQSPETEEPIKQQPRITENKPATARFCGKCGTALRENIQFCPKCGTPAKH